MFDTNKIGRKIAELRKQKNMTQPELADAMGVSFQAVSNWERGNSMPDISKLAELTDILGTTVDELLGKKNPVVEKWIESGDADVREASREEIKEAATIAQPRIVEKMAETADAEDLTVLLPFLGDRALAQLAEREYGAGRNIAAFLPFLAGEDVDAFLLRAARDGRAEIGQFLPFASADALGKAAAEYRKVGKSISAFLPFLETEDVAGLARDALRRGGVKAMAEFLPFLDEDDMEELTETLIRRYGDAGRNDQDSSADRS